jgi:uncharacterized protein (TIGR03067 family)
MRARLFVVLAAGLLVGADDKAGTKDQDRIQGTWAVASAQRGGKAVDMAAEGHIPKEFVFDGEKVTLRAGERTHEGSFKLDPDAKPKSITLTSKEDAGRTIVAAYRLEGDTLTLCVDEANMQEQPKELASKDGTRLVVVVFKRGKK